MKFSINTPCCKDQTRLKHDIQQRLLTAKSKRLELQASLDPIRKAVIQEISSISPDKMDLLNSLQERESAARLNTLLLKLKIKDESISLGKLEEQLESLDSQRELLMRVLSRPPYGLSSEVAGDLALPWEPPPPLSVSTVSLVLSKVHQLHIQPVPSTTSSPVLPPLTERSVTGETKTSMGIACVRFATILNSHVKRRFDFFYKRSLASPITFSLQPCQLPTIQLFIHFLRSMRFKSVSSAWGALFNQRVPNKFRDVSVLEFSRALRVMGYTGDPHLLASLFDAEKRGTISYSQFSAVISQHIY